jgi:ABC-type nitrate/sulfonate/bicarbonate transport system substrate-binding protein
MRSPRLKRNLFCAIFLLWLFCPDFLFAQTKKLKEMKVSYPFGGSTSFFWVAQRSGSFEKYGLAVEPVYIRGGRAGVQALISGDVKIEMQGALATISAWAQGAKDQRYIAAVGNRLDYILAAHPSIKTPAELKGKRVGISQLGASTDFIARFALRKLGLNAEKDVTILGVGGAGERWAALSAGHVQATVLQPPFTLLSRKAGFPIFVDFSKSDFEYTISGVVTTASFIRAETETVMNFVRGLADGMDFYRDERNKDKVLRMLSEYFRSNATEELEETRRSYSQLTPGLPWITVKAIENVITNDNHLAGMNLRAADLLDLSFLERLAEERKAKQR